MQENFAVFHLFVFNEKLEGTEHWVAKMPFLIQKLIRPLKIEITKTTECFSICKYQMTPKSTFLSAKLLGFRLFFQSIVKCRFDFWEAVSTLFVKFTSLMIEFKHFQHACDFGYANYSKRGNDCCNEFFWLRQKYGPKKETTRGRTFSNYTSFSFYSFSYQI